MKPARLSPEPRQRRRVARLVLLPALVLATGWSNLGAAEVAAFEIVANEGRLSPETLQVPAGVKLRLTLRNEGKTPVEFENLDLRLEKVVAPDGAATVTVQPLKAGSYPVIDDFHADTGKMLLIAR